MQTESISMELSFSFSFITRVDRIWVFLWVLCLCLSLVTRLCLSSKTYFTSLCLPVRCLWKSTLYLVLLHPQSVKTAISPMVTTEDFARVKSRVLSKTSLPLLKELKRQAVTVYSFTLLTAICFSSSFHLIPTIVLTNMAAHSKTE